MTARQPWSGSDYDAWLDRGIDQLDDEPTTEREIAVAMREQLDRLIKAIDRPSGDPCETCDLWVDIKANADEGLELARIQAMN